MAAARNQDQLIGREYLRVSTDSSGRARSVTEQHTDNEHAGELHGFSLNGENYSDPDVSASRFSRKVRGDFARLLADLQGSRFGADILVLWESSRGSRRVGEWATLVDALQDAGVKVHVTTHGRTYDPANPRDRRSLMEDAVDAEYESGKSSVRIQRALAANAAEGRPHGKVTYGYRRTYEVQPNGRRVLTGQVPDEHEAPVVRELFARLRKGDSLKAIARDFDARGIRARSGKVFPPELLRQMGLRPAYGGYRTHKPGSTAGGVYVGPLPAEPNATWPPLVDSETFWAVRRLLLAPERRTSRPGRGVHLLSLIARCAECGSAMTVMYRRGQRMYRCRDKSCATILADDLDTYAEAVITGYLARDDVIAGLRDRRDAGPEVARIRGELETARGELEQLRADGRSRRITVATVAAIEPGLVAAIGQLEERERELTSPPALAVIPPGKDAARRWAAAPMAARRQVARLLCSPLLLGTLTVHRSPETGRGHRIPAAHRVTWDRQ